MSARPRGVSAASKQLALLLTSLLSVVVAPIQLGAATFKVMTYNIHQTVGQSAGYTSTNAQRLARIVQYYQPDVITVNELEGSSTTSAQTQLQNWVNAYIPYLGGQPGTSYHTYVSPINDGYIMNAIVSRYPIYSKSAQTLDPRGLLSGTIDLPDGDDVRVYTCHLKAYSDSSSAARRQAGAETAASRISSWSGTTGNYSVLYVLCGDMNEDEDNPQYPLSGSYHPITTLLTAYLQDFEPDDLYGWTKTYSATSPSRRFDYILPSWRLRPVSGSGKSQVVNTYELFEHGQLPPGLIRQDSSGSDHLCVLATFDICAPSHAIRPGPRPLQKRCRRIYPPAPRRQP